jgi:hypothetical protein
MENKTTNELILEAGEYLIAKWAVGSGSGYQYSYHRTLTAAMKQAKKQNGSVFVCSNGIARYEVEVA